MRIKYLVTVFFIFFLSCKEEIKTKKQDFLLIKDSIDFHFEIVDSELSTIKHKIESNKIAFELIKNLKNDSIRFKYYFKNAARSYNIRSYSDYKNSTKKIINEALVLNDTLNLAKGYSYFGDYYVAIKKLDSAYYNYNLSEKLYSLKNLSEKVHKVQIEKANILFIQKDFYGCETTIFRALKYLKDSDSNELLYDVNSLLGICKTELGDYDEALKYFEKSLIYAKSFPDFKELEYFIFNNIGNVYNKKGEYEKAKYYFNEVLKNNYLSLTSEEPLFLAKQYLAFANLKTNNFNTIEKDLFEVINFNKSFNLSIVEPKLILSEYYFQLNKKELSKQVTLEAFEYSVIKDVYRDKLLVLKQLTNVFPEKEKYYSREYVKLSDSIAAIDKLSQNTFARIEYQVDELNIENQLLTAKSQKIIFYTFVIGLIFSSIYLYRWIKLNRKEVQFAKQQKQINREIYNLMIDEQLKIEEGRILEKEKISKELHDGVLGRLFGARMNLDYFASTSKEKFNENKEKFIDQIKDIETQIRQISHKLSDEKKAVIDNFQLMINKLISDQEAVMQNQIQFYSNIKQPWEFFSVDEKLNIYRILQETFQNINKYASAKNITFEVRQIENNIQITIQDDGIGFNTNKASKGIGLKNIYSRAEEMDADVTITSKIDNGSITKLIFNNKIKK